MAKRRNKNSGFTLIEVIIAIALIGIISVGIIPAFAAQFKMTVDTKNITIQSFNAQGELENIIDQLKKALVDPAIDETAIDDVTTQTKTIFGREVTMYKLSKTFPGNENKNFLVFLSKKLANMEVRQLLVAEGVSIEITNETVHHIADLKKTPQRTLNGICDTNTDPNWYANIYKWYYSDVGNPNPVFPADYERVLLPGVTPATLTGLSKYANRYIVFTVTPVDIHGIRGNEVRSSNTVYVLGKEWREGLFAWVDKDEDVSYVAGTDVMVPKGASWKWHLLDGFDTSKTFLDPRFPENTLDPEDGSLYVPMSIERASGAVVGPIEVGGSDAIEWIVDKSINLATDITVANNTDVNMKTLDGNIILYQYLKLNASGDAEYQSDGMPKLINDGPDVSTGGDIRFTTAGRGDVILQDYSKLTAGDNIILSPFGHINIFKGMVTAGESITLDSTKGNTFPGNRDIKIQDSSLVLSANGTAGRMIQIDTLNKLEISKTTIQGNTGTASQFALTAKDDATLSQVDFTNMDIQINSNTAMSGGGWSSGKLTVADGKRLTLGIGDTKVNNAGSLHLGNTGGVAFVNNMFNDIVNPLNINLSKGSSNEVVISTNYGRNVGYADSKSAESVVQADKYQNLGSGQWNLEYTASRTAAGIPNLSSLTYAFDGDDTIRIEAYASDVIEEENVQLAVRDKYSGNSIIGTINFTVVAGGAGEATVTVDKAVIKHTVTFVDHDGTILKTQLVMHGGSAQAPTPPAREGHTFAGWDMDFISVTEDMTVTAQYTQIAVPRTITFYKRNENNNSWVQHDTITVNQGETIDSLPQNPAGIWSGGYYWIFKNWNTQQNGNGSIVDTDTVVSRNMNVYAVYARARTVNFYTNYGYGWGARHDSIQVADGNPIGELMPTDPVRAGWTFTGWNTAQQIGQGTFIDATYIISSDRDLFARWRETGYVGMSFSDIAIGQYVSIGNVKFQKIDSDKLLARARIRNSGNNSSWTMNWSTANTLASNYRNNFSAVSWVNGSGLVSGDLLLGSLSDNSGRNRQLLDVLRIDNSWWGARQGTSNSAYRVRWNDGIITTETMTNNSYSCRPYISVNTTNLVVSSGAGTDGNPFILTNQ